jgi:molybdopterin molybdotransferase
VIRQEDTVSAADTVQIFNELHPWENYCHAGEDFACGDVILPKGTRLCGNALGVLSSAGLYREDTDLAVYRKVRAAVFCTGDELVPNSVRPLPKGKIYSGNEALLVSRLEDLGIEVSSCMGFFGDDPQALAASVKEALASADTVITTGGVSVGARDILHETLDLLEAERVFWRVMIKPGTPLMFSLWNGKPILSLSGNPFAASATFELFARPMLARLSGSDDLLPLCASAVLSDPFPKYGKVPRYVRAVFRDGHVTLPKGHSSGSLSSSVNTNCLAELLPRDHPFEKGETVKVILL